MIKSRQKSQVVISTSSKKKATPKISTKLLQNKTKGGRFNIYNDMMSLIPSAFKPQISKFTTNITKHEEYKYNMPPENLTYEKLQEIFSGDLQNDLNFYLEKNAEKIAEEIAEEIINIEGDKKNFDDYDINTINNVFTEKIKKYIENKEQLNIKNKELLRKNLCNILYTSHYGYNSKYEEKYGDKFDEITIGQAIDDEKSFNITTIKKPKAKSVGGNYDKFIHYIVNGGGPRDRSPGNPHPLPPNLPKKFVIYFPSVIKYLWNYLFDMLKGNYLNKKRIGPPSEELSDESLFKDIYDIGSSPLKYDHYEIMGELHDIQQKIIDSLKTDKDKKKIKEEFDFVDNNVDSKIITYSIYLQRQIEHQKKTVSSIIYQTYINNKLKSIMTQDNKQFIKVYQPFKNLYIYGTLNPDQFNRTKLLLTMFFLLEMFKIKNFINLQDCEEGSYDLNVNILANCNPYDRRAERDMFELANNIKQIKGNYINIKDIVDMTAGSLLAWNEIYNIPEASADNRTIIHCYAGKGRTGTTLLFLRLRDINDIDIVSRLNQKHLGYNNIIDLINNLSELFNPKKSSQIQEEANLFLDEKYWDEVVKEVFKIKQIWHVELLRQRLNRIFYFLAKSYNVTQFYLYAIPPSEYRSFQQFYNFANKATSYPDMMSFFSTPHQVNINWDKFKLEKLKEHQSYIDGIII